MMIVRRMVSVIPCGWVVFYGLLLSPIFLLTADVFTQAQDTIIETEILSGDSTPQPLPKKSPEAQPELPEWQIKGALAALEDAIPEVRAAALRKLGELEALDRIPQSKIPLIVDLAEHPNIAIRRQAIETLGKLGEKGEVYIPQLVTLLNHENPDVRSAAASALGNLGPRAQDTIPQLLVLVGDPDPNVRAAAARALGNVGDGSVETTAQIVSLLKDPYWQVRAAAATALENLGTQTNAFIPNIVALLQDADWEIRMTAAMALGNLGDLTIPYVARITGLLKHNDWGIRAAALRALGNLGAQSGAAIPQITALLKDESWGVRSEAARALGNIGQDAQASLPQIAGLLKDEDQNVRAAAAWALGNLGQAANTQIPDLAERLKDDEAIVRAAAVQSLGNLSDGTSAYLPQITAMLKDTDWEVRAAAAKALSHLDEDAKGAVPQIATLLEDKDWYVRSSSARALGSLHELAQDVIPQIAARLQDEDGNVRSAAAWALGDLGELAKAYTSQLAELLEDNHPGVRYAAARALGSLGELDVEPIPQIINPIYKDPSRTVELRFLSHLVGAGKEEVETLLKWIGDPQANYPVVTELPHGDARKALEVFDAVWEKTVRFPEVVASLTEQIATIVTQGQGKWNREDLPVLREQVEHLASVESPHTETVKQVVTALKIKYLFLRVVTICAIHPLCWLLLLLLYPFSARLRAFFFWNPSIRKIFGLAYIDLALTGIPFLRRWMFRPFRKALLAEAALDDFDNSLYFEGSEVQRKGRWEMLPIAKAIPRIKGQMVLEGESGLGKTMFSRYLLKRMRGVAAYLSAQACLQGVFEALQGKLDVVGQDTQFFRKLITRGAIDICIDGLNEVSAEHRARVIRFVQHEFQGNFLIITQPTEWTPPANAKTYVLQPLRRDQIEGVMVKCYPMFATTTSVSRSAYTQACHAYLAEVLNATQSQELREANQRILANPMNLTVVAQLGLRGQDPDLLHLPDQLYHMLEAEYIQMYPHKVFPLIEFSDCVYWMRRRDEIALRADEFFDELRCLERSKMVVARHAVGADGKPAKSWCFRHETIMDFFVAQTFLGAGDTRIDKHFRDIRFRGVYFLLASLLPFEAAMTFRDKVSQYATEISDPTTSEAFMQLYDLLEVQEKITQPA